MGKKEIIKKEGKKLPKEFEEYIGQYMKENTVKNMADIQEMMRSMFGPTMQKMLEAEMDAKLGYSKNERADTDNSRNGYYRGREVNSNYGEIPIRVPRDRNGEIESDIVPKYSRNINGFDDQIIGLYGIGMSDRDISDQIYQLFGCTLTPEMISTITDKIIPDIQEWQKRKLEKKYPVIFIDAIHFSVKDNGQVVKKAAYIVLGVDRDGNKGVLSIVIGENESAKMWLNILNDLKNRGVQDILIVCADGLTGIKDAINIAFPESEYQRCIVHQIRNSLKYVKHEDKNELCQDLKTVYTASTAEQGFNELICLEEKWGKKYPSAIKSWIDNWDSLATFFKFSGDLRKVMYTTNPIESLNSSYRRANKNRVVFPTNMSLLKTLYLATKNIEKRWTMRYKEWDKVLAQLQILYPERI